MFQERVSSFRNDNMSFVLYLKSYDCDKQIKKKIKSNVRFVNESLSDIFNESIASVPKTQMIQLQCQICQ